MAFNTGGGFVYGGTAYGPGYGAMGGGFGGGGIPAQSGGGGTNWLGWATLIAQTLGGLFQGYSQGKVSDAQLEIARQQLGLSKEQFEFMKEQALRQNQIADHNTRIISPLIMQALARSRENLAARPSYERVRSPSMNNPYQVGHGRWGGDVPGPAEGLPWLNYGNSGSPAVVGGGTGPTPPTHTGGGAAALARAAWQAKQQQEDAAKADPAPSSPNMDPDRAKAISDWIARDIARMGPGAAKRMGKTGKSLQEIYSFVWNDDFDPVIDKTRGDYFRRTGRTDAGLWG